jgi:hypothetical protein
MHGLHGTTRRDPRLVEEVSPGACMQPALPPCAACNPPFLHVQYATWSEDRMHCGILYQDFGRLVFDLDLLVSSCLCTHTHTHTHMHTHT